MRIRRNTLSQQRSRQIDSDIAQAMAPAHIKGRICGVSCTMTCPQCGSKMCQCLCSPCCPQAPRALSTDPDRHPIEPGILPLVYEMKRAGMFSPSWSCEGHVGSDGSLSKIPRVWFTCESMTHLRLLADGLGSLRHAGKLRAPWQVAVTFSDPDNAETTFSLEPAPASADAPSLPGLQGDVREIAGSLHHMIADGARRLQRQR
jgi:hypothetical protein